MVEPQNPPQLDPDLDPDEEPDPVPSRNKMEDLLFNRNSPHSHRHRRKPTTISQTTLETILPFANFETTSSSSTTTLLLSLDQLC